MIGEQEARLNEQKTSFCLENHIPADHLLRKIDKILDFSELREELKAYYSHTGRPSIDPELMIRMLLVGYCYGVRSERKLCEEVNFNLAYRWFCRLGLEGSVPEHSTFSKNRHGRFRESDLFRKVFESVVQRCIEASLVKGEGFAIDASFIRADTARQRYVRGEVDWGSSKEQSRAVKEYIDTLDKTPSLRRPQKSISLTDPMAQWSGAKGPAEFYYSTNYMIDIDNNIIMDVEATPSVNSLEVATTRSMTERIERRHKIKPKRMMADKIYSSADNLNYLDKVKQIEPHIPVRDQSRKDASLYGREDFVYVPEDNEYECPEKHRLHTTGKITSDKTILYRSRNKVCSACPMKPRCCPYTPNKKISRSIYEESRDVARRIVETDEYQNQSRCERKKVEMSFAHMKKILGFTRTRLRGLLSVNDECLLVATAQNLRKMARYWGTSPPIPT